MSALSAACRGRCELTLFLQATSEQEVPQHHNRECRAAEEAN